MDQNPFSDSSTEKWFRDSKCRFKMINVMRDSIDNNNIKKGNNQDWTVYLPCNYTYSQQELSKLKPYSARQKIFIIKGCDNLSRKDLLWKHLSDFYGYQKATKIMPMTYILYELSDIKRFSKEYSKKDVYILKNNKQRQTGLKLSRDRKDILNGIDSGYLIVQKILQNPYLVDGRKINIRIYLLVLCRDKNQEAYVYQNGFIYYTKIKFEPNTMNPDHIITTGYLDREVYERNPLTLQDFLSYLGYPQNHILFERIKNLMSDTMQAVSPSICTECNVSKQLTFQLFGVDVAVNNRLEPQIMEINKGPDDSRDHDFVKIWNN
jgi:hypothetical protein